MEYKAKYKYKERLELYDKLVRVHLVLNDIKIQEKNIKLLVYFCCFGINESTYNKIIENGLASSLQIIYNTRTILGKNNLIENQKHNVWVVNEKLSALIENSLEFRILTRI